MKPKAATLPPTEPLRYTFFTTIAVAIYKAVKAKGGSTKGAVLIISQASLESGFGEAATRAGDYNLFGQMTLGDDFKRKTSHGKVKDYSKSGGYEASIAYHLIHISTNKQTGVELIKMANFSSQDIDDAFNTGTDYPTDKERHDGKYAYNADMGEDKKNHYGEHLYRQMGTTKKRMVEALDFKIRRNEETIKQLSAEINQVGQPPNSLKQPNPVGLLPEQRPVENKFKNYAEISRLTQENQELTTIKIAIQSVPL